MKNKSKYYRIPVCIFIFVVGSITALLFASVLNDVLTTGSISTDLTDFSTTISGIFGGEKPRKLYLLLEALVVLLCVVYFVCAERTYKTDTYKVTDNISVPVPSGQGQHGTAWFMSDKTKRRAFDYISISPADPLVSRLVSIGRERYIAIENGEIFNPPKADQTLTHSAGIVLAREMSRGTERLPCITDDYHTLTIGATRCGKSRCLVLQSICALALAGEGIVANDPKGELYHYTHSFLETLGYKVHVIDFNTPKKSDRYNPLQSIINVVNENRIDDAQNCVWEFVTFLVEKNDHSEPIWTNGECSVIAAAVMCVVYDNQNHPEFQNLTNVYNFIVYPILFAGTDNADFRCVHRADKRTSQHCAGQRPEKPLVLLQDQHFRDFQRYRGQDKFRCEKRGLRLHAGIFGEPLQSHYREQFRQQLPDFIR